MFAAMRNLPVRPEFPVFGLSDTYDGFRWLVLWQRREGPWRGDVTEISLGHGHPDDGPFLVVNTVCKQLARDLGGGASRGEIGVDYVATKTLLNIDDCTDQPVDWHIESVLIDGVAHQSQVRHHGPFRAIVVELPTLVIGVWGPVGSLPEPWGLADISGRLDDYVVGSASTPA